MRGRRSSRPPHFRRRRRVYADRLRHRLREPQRQGDLASRTTPTRGRPLGRRRRDQTMRPPPRTPCRGERTARKNGSFNPVSSARAKRPRAARMDRSRPARAARWIAGWIRARESRRGSVHTVAASVPCPPPTRRPRGALGRRGSRVSWAGRQRSTRAPAPASGPARASGRGIPQIATLQPAATSSLRDPQKILPKC